MESLETSNDLLGDRRALEAAFQRDGYLFLRGVVDLDAVERLRTGLVEFLVDEGCATPGSPAMSTGCDTSVLGAHPAGLHRRQLWETFVAEPAVQDLIEAIVGPSPLSVPISQYQFKSPVRRTEWLGCHQDHCFNPGLHFRTFWVPLMAIDAPLGGLALAPRHHTRGPLHDPVGGAPAIDVTTIDPDAWCRADYEPGDLVVFHGHTPHLGLPNLDPARLRLSVDVRFQTAADPPPAIGIVERVVEGADHPTVTVSCIDGRRVTARVDGHTVLRTNLAQSAPIESLVGRRVICADEGGTATLIRTVV